MDKGIALKYFPKAPKVIAKASGTLLEKLLELARENNITIHRDPDLAEILSNLQTGSEIPEDLFTAISEVLAYCYKVNSEFKKRMNSIGI